MTVLLEVCVDDARGLEAAVAGGADRIELCSALSVGGLTPSPGLMRLAAEAPVPVYGMIRPRPGGFVYDEPELCQMERDIVAAAEFGLSGIVIGASRQDGRLDETALTRLLAASPLPATLHRAIDLAPDLAEAVETAIALGFERVLSSGGEKTALQGLAALELMVRRAAGRILVMPGSGVTADNACTIVTRLGVGEIHASCSSPAEPGSQKEIALGFAADAPRRTDVEKVRALKTVLELA